PYGCLSYEKIYEYTLEAVKFLFNQGCQLVILACNTASAQALRTIQQTFLPKNYPNRRVLGVIRPCTERVLDWSQTKHVGLLGTRATVDSNSYGIEIGKFAPELILSQQACPDWVALVEQGEVISESAQKIVKRNLDELLQKDPHIDSIILACTHFSHLTSAIKKALGRTVRIIHQGPIVAQALQNYLIIHPELEQVCLKTHSEEIFTTGNAEEFRINGHRFMNFTTKPLKISLS
ncbi:MAG: aspartate/glutamate racemase family protein, partial [Lentisphaeria bacterium]|nr:aspartate/glutamate racemase family protein [Lentisphaeria bacterium]